MSMANDLFPGLPFDNEPGMRPVRERGAAVSRFLKKNAVTIVLFTLGAI